MPPSAQNFANNQKKSLFTCLIEKILSQIKFINTVKLALQPESASR